MATDLLSMAAWLVTAAAMAYGQGLLLPWLRTVPPGAMAARHSRALHGWLVLAYFAPVALAPATWPMALVARFLVFDPVLNHGAGRPLFEVGQTAAMDKLLRKAAPGRPDRLRFALWLAGLLLATGALWWLRA